MRFFVLFFQFFHRNCLIFGLSTNWPLGPQESCPSVRMFVRSYVRNAFSRKPFITFSETLQLVRACKREKNVPSAFLKKFPFWPKTVPKIGHFGPKCPKMEVFRIFSQSLHQNLLIFCTKPSLWSKKKYFFAIFWEN